MFYVIETQYVGPNSLDSQHIDSHVFEVATQPAMTNSSHDVCTEGWCGTTNDSSVYAHGEYHSQQAAEEWITQHLSESGYREDELDQPAEQHMDDAQDGIVARYRPVRYEPMTAEATKDWVFEALDEVAADTSDQAVADLVAMLQESSRTEINAELDEDTVREAINERQQELRDEQDAEL